jgi:hypothetical protein
MALSKIKLNQIDASLVEMSTLSTDITLGGLTPSDSLVSTQAAVKSYVDTAVSGLPALASLYKGALDASLSPNYPAASVAEWYVISVAGKIGGASGVAVEAGDIVMCLTTNGGGTQAAVGTNFTIIQNNLIGAVTSSSSSSTDANIAVFDSTSGKIIKDGGTAISGLVPTSRQVNGHALSADVTLDTSDVAATEDKNYVTDADLTNLSNLSGTNTGDQDLSGLVVLANIITENFVSTLAQTEFVLDHTPTKILHVSRNGQILLAGSGNDYTITTDTVTVAVDLAAGENIEVLYIY